MNYQKLDQINTKKWYWTVYLLIYIVYTYYFYLPSNFVFNFKAFQVAFSAVVVKDVFSGVEASPHFLYLKSDKKHRSILI